MSVYGWKSFMEDEDQPEKPRIYGVAEMIGPNYTLLNRNVLQFGYIVLTMSPGIVDHEEARRKNMGGKVLGFFDLI